jgi:two-component sensor histidine kinase
MPLGGPNSERVLILAGRRRDADVASRLLAEGGFPALVCHNVSELTREIRQGAGCAVLTDDAIDGSAALMLHSWIQEQPAWSDFPIIVLIGKVDEPTRERSTRELQDTLGNVSLVEKPFHPQTLASVARAALRSRRRQYEARELLERYELLARELQHRTKNLLAVILSIAGASLRNGGDGPDVFISRLHALAAAQNLLMEGDGRGTFLSDIVYAVTSSFGDRIIIDGPQVHLNSTLAQGFALIVHELATNAVKHGALSRDEGSITSGWSVSVEASETTLLFKWQERGGPLVLPPKRKSFGTILLERAVPASGPPPRLHYEPQGFIYEHSVKLVV